MQTHFVTGGTGFVGRYLVEALLQGGDAVYIFLRYETLSSPKIKEYLTDLSRFGNKLRLCKGDILAHNLGMDTDVLLEISSKEIIFWHLAANLSFSESEKKAVSETNIRGTENFVKFVNGLKGKLIFMSTAYVWGDYKRVCRETEPYGDIKHRNIYESTKLAAERIVRQRSNLPYLILRPSIIIGNAYEGKAVGCTFGYYRYTYMFHFLKKRIIDRFKAPLLVLPYPENCTVDLVPVDYVVDAAIRLSKNSAANNRIFHLTNPAPGSYLFYFSALLDDLGLGSVYKLKLPAWLFNLLFRAAALIPGPTRKYFRSVCWYLPYITQKSLFDRSNVETFTDVEFPELNRGRMRKINLYAKNTIYDRMK